MTNALQGWSALWLVIVGIAVGVVSSAEAQNQYGFREECAPELFWTQGIRLNDNSEIAGSYYTPENDAWRIFKKIGNAFVPLPLPFGYVEAHAIALGLNGIVYGSAFLASGASQAYQWVNTDTPTPLLSNTLSTIGGVNNGGQIVGSFILPGTNQPIYGFKITGSQVDTLFPIADGAGSEAFAINANNVVVGTEYSDTVKAIEWNSQQPSYVGSLGGIYSKANDINDNGVIVGVASTAQNARHAFLKKPGQPLLDVHFSGGSSEAQFINNAGTVVGTYSTFNYFIYDARHGSRDIYTINSNIPNTSEPVIWDLNNKGEITMQNQPNCYYVLFPHGDMDCDGQLGNFDIDLFVQALFNPSQYTATHPNCDIHRADINDDGAINLLDVDPFVNLLIG